MANFNSDQIYKTYVRGDTDYYTNNTWAEVSKDWDFELLKSHMRKIGWNETTPFLKVDPKHLKHMNSKVLIFLQTTIPIRTIGPTRSTNLSTPRNVFSF